MTKTVAIHDLQYQANGVNAQRQYPNEQLVRFMAANWFALPPSERKKLKILELGCGSGGNLWMIAKEGFSAYGLDGSKKAIEIAHTHLEEKWGVKADLRVATFDVLPYESAYFDGIVDVLSLLCISLEESRQAFSEIHRTLKPRGRFFRFRLSDHSVLFLNGGGQYIDAATVDNVPNEALPLNNNGTMSFWSPALCKQEYEALGFTIESIERIGRTYPGGAYVEFLAVSASRAD